MKFFYQIMMGLGYTYTGIFIWKFNGIELLWCSVSLAMAVVFGLAMEKEMKRKWEEDR